MTDLKTRKTLLKLRNRAYSALSVKLISDALVVMGYKVKRSGRGDNAQLVITAPNGAHREWKGPVQDYALAGWLFKETGSDEVAATTLGMPSVEDEKRERENKARDWTNTGTCPACFRNIKMRNGKIVLHGYERPGDGCTHGSCFGVDYEPYERSTKGTAACRTHFEAVKHQLEQTVVRLSNPDFCEPMTTMQRVRWETVMVTVTRDEDEQAWRRLVASSIGNTEQQLRTLVFDIKLLTEKIEAWHPGMKMPEEIARARCWI